MCYKPKFNPNTHEREIFNSMVNRSENGRGYITNEIERIWGVDPDHSMKDYDAVA